MTAQEASVVVAMLMAAYPNARLPDGTVLAYESFLAELDRDTAAQAVRGIIRTSKFMPTIAEIVSACESQRVRSDIPYHRRFRPPADDVGAMKPSELKAEIAAFLGSLK